VIDASVMASLSSVCPIPLERKTHACKGDATGKTEVSWLESAVLLKDRGAWRIQFFHSTRVPAK
jgi:hypothetical protein